MTSSYESQIKLERSLKNKSWYPMKAQGLFRNKSGDDVKVIDACSPEGWFFIHTNENMLIPRHTL